MTVPTNVLGFFFGGGAFLYNTSQKDLQVQPKAIKLSGANETAEWKFLNKSGNRSDDWE